MKDKLVELLKVKSIVTLMIISVLCYLAVIDKIEPKEYMLIVSMIITYYFAKEKGA